MWGVFNVRAFACKTLGSISSTANASNTKRNKSTSLGRMIKNVDKIENLRDFPKTKA